MRKITALQPYVSVDRLKEKDACPHYQELFAKTFPKPVRITRKNLQKTARWMEFWWFELNYLKLSNKTYQMIRARAFAQAREQRIARKTPETRQHTIAYRRLHIDALADYLELP